MREKGIGMAIDAVREANKRIGSSAYHLVVFGQIEAGQQEWFEELRRNSGEDCVWEYGGLVPFDASTEVLKGCFALLFPTYYEGEGFAGTLIDAFGSGVPVIASDWRYNSEIVADGVTGKIVKTEDPKDLAKALIWAFEHQRVWNDKKTNCLKEATKYLPCEVIKPLVNAIFF